MFSERVLTSEHELAAFSRSQEHAGGHPVSRQYLRRSRVTGFFVGERMVGGYVFNGEAPFRTLESVPDTVAADILTPANSGGPYELTCVWMEPRARRTLVGNRMWLSILGLIVAHRGRRVLVSSVHDSLLELYEGFGFVPRHVALIDAPGGRQVPKTVLTLDHLTPLLLATLRTVPGRYAHAAKLRWADWFTRPATSRLAPA